MKRNVLAAALIVILSFALFKADAYADEPALTENSNSVKVGYFYYPGYHIIDDDGNYSGYGFELYEKMSVYGNFDAEYVGYDKTFAECRQMLYDGEIDILPLMTYKGEKLNGVVFSEYEGGSFFTDIYTYIGNDKITAKDYDTYDGIKIGCFASDFSKMYLPEFAASHHFDYDCIVYDNFDEMIFDLRVKHSIDAVCGTLPAGIDGLRKFDNLSNNHFYFLMREDNSACIEAVNMALLSIAQYEPDAMELLNAKYFNIESDDVVYFSATEQNYINSRLSDVITVGVLKSKKPFSYYENNELEGIIPSIVSNISALTGLNFSYKVYGDANEFNEAIINKDFEIIADATLDYNLANELDYSLSAPYFVSPVCRVFLKSRSNSTGYAGVYNKTSTILKNPDYIGKEIKYFDSAEDCYKALLAGVIDEFYTSVYQAPIYISGPNGNRVAYEKIENVQDYFCVGSLNNDKVLTTIISKSLYYLDSEALNEKIISEFLGIKDISIKSLIAENPTVVWLFALFVFVLLFIGVYLLFKNIFARKEKQLAIENSNFAIAVIGTNQYTVSFSIKDDILKTSIYGTVKNSDGTFSVVRNDYDNDMLKMQSYYLSGEDKERFAKIISIENFRHIYDNNDPQYHEFKFLNGSEGYSYTGITLSRIESNDDDKRILMLVRDIDNIRQTEDEKRKTLAMALETARKMNYSRTVFLSQMSHDIRTPMNAISGMTQLALRNIDDRDKVLDYLEKIEESSSHMTVLINDILDMSRIETGKLVFKSEQMDIVDTLEKSIAMIRREYRKSNVTIHEDVADVFHKEIISDPVRLSQVFNNIISNAVKYSDKGKDVYVSMTEKESIGNSNVVIEFTVRDNGVGMDDDTKSKLFVPFERGHLTQNREGVGLGMSITKSILDGIGAIISVDSKLGEGTTIKVKFSFELEKEHKMTDLDEIVGRDALIISLDEMLAANIASILKEGKMNVDTYASLQDAYAALDGNNDMNFKIIVVALMQPIPDEIGVLKQIRNAFGEDPLLIDVTGLDYSLATQFIDDEFSFDGFVSSPIYKNSFIRTISDGLDKRARRNKNKLVATGKGRRVLIVEDVEINAMFAEAIVEMKGFIPETAVNGKEACEKLINSADNYYSMVLMDVQMPVMNGYEATGRIRSSGREYLEKIPIIAMSANAFPEDILKCKDAGMDDHLAKPVDINLFGRMVDKYIRD